MTRTRISDQADFWLEFLESWRREVKSERLTTDRYCRWRPGYRGALDEPFPAIAAWVFVLFIPPSITLSWEPQSCGEPLSLPVVSSTWSPNLTHACITQTILLAAHSSRPLHFTPLMPLLKLLQPFLKPSRSPVNLASLIALPEPYVLAQMTAAGLVHPLNTLLLLHPPTGLSASLGGGSSVLLEILKLREYLVVLVR